MTINNNEKNVELYFSHPNVSLDGKSSVLALGTFDGVHIAHRHLLTRARELKEGISADLCGAWCFEESPASVLRCEKQVQLTSKEEKIKHLLDCGLDFVAMGRFHDFKDVSAEDFIKSVLQDRLGCIGTVSGYDHRFGHKGLGTPLMLEEVFGKNNTVIVPKIVLNEEIVGSTQIRAHLSSGDVKNANAMLGRCFSITSKVTEGKRLGRRLGFPTANQPYPAGTAPLKHGVYATLCVLDDGKEYFGVTNVGIRPSISEGDDHALNCETHLINFSGDIYGSELTLRFCEFLREETTFSSLESLTDAIKTDTERAIEYFRQGK